MKYFQQMMEGNDLGGDPTEQSTDVTDQSTDTTEGSETSTEQSWRTKWAGEDESKLKRISRYATESDVLNALVAAQDRIRSGELKAPFPEEGTPEEQSNWRKENGLPESPDKYDLSFESGLVIGDEDKPFIEEYLKSAYETNQTPSQVKANLEWYYQIQEKQQEERYEKDKLTASETNELLREEWGPEYKAHKNSISAFLSSMPEEARENFMSARMPNGVPVLSDPNVLKWMLNQALEINPVTTLVPPGENQLQGIEDEIQKMEKMMGDRKSDYWTDPKMQERYRKLVEYRDKAKA